MDKAVVSIQMALFFKDLIRNPEKVLQKVANNFNDIEFMSFFVQNQIYPVASSITTKPNTNMISATPERFDFIKIFISKTDLKSNFTNDARNILEYICDMQTISRIGLVSTLFKEVDNPIKKIKKMYFNNTITENLAELSIRKNEQTIFHDMQINNIYSDEIAKNITIFGDKKSGIITRHDINTPFIEGGIDKKILNEFYNENIDKIFK